jgi:type IV secretory pathway TrbL component
MGSAFGAGVQWNPITWIAAAVIISILAVLLVHKIFGIILWIPDNVMRWVGGQGPQLGEGQSEQQAHGRFVGAAGIVQKSGPQKEKGGARGGLAARKGPGAGAGAGGGGEEVGGEDVGGNDVAGGGETVSEAPPTKPE